MEKSAIIYKVPLTIFVPTSQVVEQTYINGRKGEQLWEQIFQGKLTGNMWTIKEILALNPTIVTI